MELLTPSRESIGSEASVVYVVDDDPGIRQGLMSRIESEAFHARAFASGERFLEEMDPAIGGCVIADMYMQRMTGLELLQRLRAMHCELPMILISGHADVPVAVQGMKLGAVDFLQKPIEPGVLIETIRRAIRTGQLQRQEQTGKDAVKQRFRLLSSRELGVLDHVMKGESSKQIASQLGISVKTVSRHRSNIMTKTGASNTADVVRLAQLADILSQQR